MQSSAGVSEVVVTAERRVQDLQHSSLAISVITPEQAKQVGLAQVRDLTKIDPGVQIGQGGPATQIYIRGVGDFGSTPVTNPAVAFNVDGVYVSRANAIEGNFFDLERIEVLKGPQGTLYGRNASGGAINVITGRPQLGKTFGHVEGEVGDYRLGRVEASLNVPVGDSLAVRAAFQIIRRNGYATQGFDDANQESIRLSALWKPSDSFSVRATADHTHVGGNGPAYVFKGPLLPAVASLLTARGIPTPTDPRTSVTDPAVAPLFFAAIATVGACYPNNVIPVASAGSQGVLGPSVQGLCPTGFSSLLKPAVANGAKVDNKFDNVSVEANWDLGFATLTVLPAYRRVRNDYQAYPLIVFDDSANGQPEKSDTYSLETRLGQTHDHLTWVVGAYFYREDQDAHAGGTDATQVLLGNTETSTKFTTESRAVFGQATYALTDRWRVIGGARVLRDTRTIDGAIFVFDTPLTFPFNPGGVCFKKANPCVSDSYSGDRTFKKSTYKVGTEYDLTNHNMLFMTYATGVKAGGFNQFSQLGVAGNQASYYAPESLGALELGSRNRFFESRLQVNAEAFRWDYKDAQETFLTQNNLGGNVFGYTNAGSATLYGLDVDVTAKITPMDTVHVGGEYLESNFDDFSYRATGLSTLTTGCLLTQPSAANPFQTVNCSGRPLIRAPKWSGVASYTHRFELSDGSAIEASISGQFASSRYLAVDYTAATQANSYVMGDVFVTYRSPGRKWSLGGYVRNFNNARVYTGTFTAPFIVPGLVAANIGAPRTAGLQLGVDF